MEDGWWRFKPDLIRGHLHEVALDYLAAGIDPGKTTIVVQSMVPEIAELTVLFSMFVTVNALRHNPTIKSESRNSGLDEMYYGFLGYPVSQAADITFCKATIIPVGTDGNAKMSKSLGNSIELDSAPEEIAYKIRRAQTDPARIHKNDPGHPEICAIYHQAFHPTSSAEIHEGCTRGTMGCAACKQQITAALEELIAPMRDRRAYYKAKPKLVNELLISGTERARSIAKETMGEVREAMSLDYFR